MSNYTDGGPAFPVPGWPDDEHFNGMSLRDHFAGLALAAMIGHPHKDGEKCGKNGVAVLAGFAYEYADAMLKERAK